MDYDAAVKAATTAQNLDPILAALATTDLEVALEQTGGFCMVVYVDFADRRYGITSDGIDPARPYLLVEYNPAIECDEGQLVGNDLSVSEVVWNIELLTEGIDW